VPYEPAWLAQMAGLARAHARLAPPYLAPTDEDVERGLSRHAYWRFYSPGLEGGQVLLAVEDGELLAAAQCGFAGYGWGYGAVEDDGPEWLHQVHFSLFWLFAWPGWTRATEGGKQLAANIVGKARREGLPGVEVFRGGPGFLPFGTQLSSHWPHLWEPLRATGFRQPRDLLVYGGETAPDALPPVRDVPGLALRARRGRIEAWLNDEPAGLCTVELLSAPGHAAMRTSRGAAGWAVVRRLVVDRSMRGQGIGTALLAEQLRRLHARGIERYLLHIADDADEFAAKALYAKFGRVVDRQHVLRVSF
jgi:GNAT superfamily N-acetyltransferase